MSENPGEHRLSAGTLYHLQLQDGRVFGHVRIEEVDNSGWAHGRFELTPAFEEIRGLFERAHGFARDQIIPLWEEAADAIAALAIQVIDADTGIAYSGLRVFVEGSEVSVGMPLR